MDLFMHLTLGTDVCQVGSLAGAVHLLNNNVDVLR